MSRGAGSLLVLPPTNSVPYPQLAGWGKCSPGAVETPSSLAPRNWGPRKGRVEKKKVRLDLRAGWFQRRRLPFSTPPYPPQPPPRLVSGGAASPRPRAARPAPSSRRQEPGPSGRARPGPGSGVSCSWQCGGRGAGGRRCRLLITRPPSPGSRNHGQPGAPARRERHRPGREVGPSRARVATPVGRGCWMDSFAPPASTFGLAGDSGPAGGATQGGASWRRAMEESRPGSWHLRLSVAFYNTPSHVTGHVRNNPFRLMDISHQMPFGP